MKITLDIPNTTRCAFFNYVYYDDKMQWLCMGCRSVADDELVDGNEIKAEPLKPRKGGDPE